METADFVVVGGGVVGLCVARELRRRHPAARVVVLEKEPSCGLHASGRNSGVLHAGFYYAEDSLKARFCREGNAAMAAYCESRGVPVNRCGKLVVAASPAETAALHELCRRGAANGVRLERLDQAAARCLEPRAKAVGGALWSPGTAVVDPGRVMEALAGDAAAEGVELRLGAAYLGRRGRALLTPAGPLEAGYLVNAAGLHADRVARDFGFSRDYRILPFKGHYLCSDEPPGAVRTNVYPVPDLANPFLGVHVTVAADGRHKIGPTAVPALWREHYEGLANLSLGDAAQVAATAARLFIARPGLAAVLASELLKHSRRRMVALAGRLLEGVRPERYRCWGRPGIRAQLVDVRAGRLVMDFVIEGDARSLHVLNAVSPAFTCALPFARFACDRGEELSR